MANENIINGIKNIIDDFETDAQLKMQSGLKGEFQYGYSLDVIAEHELESVQRFRQIYQDFIANKILKMDSNDFRFFYDLIVRYKKKLCQYSENPHSLSSLRLANKVLTFLFEKDTFNVT